MEGFVRRPCVKVIGSNDPPARASGPATSDLPRPELQTVINDEVANPNPTMTETGDATRNPKSHHGNRHESLGMLIVSGLIVILDRPMPRTIVAPEPAPFTSGLRETGRGCDRADLRCDGTRYSLDPRRQAGSRSFPPPRAANGTGSPRCASRDRPSTPSQRRTT